MEKYMWVNSSSSECSNDKFATKQEALEDFSSSNDAYGVLSDDCYIVEIVNSVEVTFKLSDAE